jgi:hypothetical protein
LWVSHGFGLWPSHTTGRARGSADSLDARMIRASILARQLLRSSATIRT